MSYDCDTIITVWVIFNLSYNERDSVTRFLVLVFYMNQFPPALEYPIRTVSNFVENLQRYSQVKVHHRYQRHRRQILPPVLLVLLIPVANNGNSIRLLRPESDLEDKNVSIS